MKKIALISLIVMAFSAMYADMNNSAAAYIRMGIGARVIAMGEAGTASASDVSAAYWNPAGLTNLKDIEVASMYALNMAYDRNYKYAAIGKRFDFGSLALNWVNASVDDIAGFDDNDQPTGFFNNNEHNISLSYANSIYGLQYGFTPKFYMSKIDDEMETGFGVDLGFKYDVNQYMVAGVMMRDAYASLAGDRIPYELSLGVAAYPFLGITIAADAKMEQSEEPTFAVGAEYWTSIGKDTEANSKLSVVSVEERNTWQEVLSDARTGLRIGFNDQGFSVGTGLRLRNFQVDYAFRLNNHEVFNDEHLLSLLLRF